MSWPSQQASASLPLPSGQKAKDVARAIGTWRGHTYVSKRTRQGHPESSQQSRPQQAGVLQYHRQLEHHVVMWRQTVVILTQSRGNQTLLALRSEGVCSQVGPGQALTLSIRVGSSTKGDVATTDRGVTIWGRG